MEQNNLMPIPENSMAEDPMVATKEEPHDEIVDVTNTNEHWNTESNLKIPPRSATVGSAMSNNKGLDADYRSDAAVAGLDDGDDDDDDEDEVGFTGPNGRLGVRGSGFLHPTSSEQDGCHLQMNLRGGLQVPIPTSRNEERPAMMKNASAITDGISTKTSERESESEDEGSDDEDEKWKNLIPFQDKLQDMLDNSEENGWTDTLSWTDKSKGFAIQETSQFHEVIIPTYYAKPIKFSTFIRNLHTLGMKQLSNKGGVRVFTHPLFSRDNKREQCQGNSIDIKKKQSTNPSKLKSRPSSSSAARAKRPSDTKPKSTLNPLNPKTPFANKLFNILMRSETDPTWSKTISWIEEGTAFEVHNVESFETIVLPTEFTTCSMSNFCTQLMWYGFDRVGNGRYRHRNFTRNNQEQAVRIPRLQVYPESWSAEFSNFKESNLRDSSQWKAAKKSKGTASSDAPKKRARHSSLTASTAAPVAKRTRNENGSYASLPSSKTPSSSKPILLYDSQTQEFKGQYESAAAAARALAHDAGVTLGGFRSGMGRVFAGNQQSYAGYTFKYASTDIPGKQEAPKQRTSTVAANESAAKRTRNKKNGSSASLPSPKTPACSKPVSKGVLVFDFQTKELQGQYEPASAAARALVATSGLRSNCLKSGISHVLRGGRESYAGYTFTYAPNNISGKREAPKQLASTATTTAGETAAGRTRSKNGLSSSLSSLSPSSKRHLFKGVVVYYSQRGELQGQYESVAAAARALAAQSGRNAHGLEKSIEQVLSGKQKSASGYTFKYSCNPGDLVGISDDNSADESTNRRAKQSAAERSTRVAPPAEGPNGGQKSPGAANALPAMPPSNENGSQEFLGALEQEDKILKGRSKLVQLLKIRQGTKPNAAHDPVCIRIKSQIDRLDNDMIDLITDV